MNKKVAISIALISIFILGGIWFVNFKRTPKDVIIEDKVEEKTTIRQPSSSGTFYPADAGQLENRITHFLSEAELVIDNSKTINVLIVPHAGYNFSGSIAGSGFKQIENRNYNQVILIGSSHQYYFQGVAVDESTAWKTPLGEIEIDLINAQKIVDTADNFIFNSQAHAQEHSLEVELPFLQTVLSNFKIVPILLGNTNNNDLQNLADAIYDIVDKNTLIVISTDLSHYPRYEIANSVDERTIRAILSGDPEKFSQTIARQMSESYHNLDTCVCGENAVKTGMIIAQNLISPDRYIQDDPGSETGWRLIKYANSGDITGEKSRVVGYAALAFTSQPTDSQLVQEQEEENQKKELNAAEKKELLQIARQTLENYINKGIKPGIDNLNPNLEEKAGVFVCFKKNGDLRGCMGDFQPDTPLWQTVIDQTINAATEDPRFPPITTEEIAETKIEISILSKPELIDDWKKIELGKHGVIVQKGQFSGTYLPQVGIDQDWESLEEFLAHLCIYKAKLPGNCFIDPNVKLLAYTADVFSE